MKNRRYFLVILDSAGGAVRRVSVSRKLVQTSAYGLAAAFVLGLMLLVHGAFVRQQAIEAEELAQENETLLAIHDELTRRLPQGRMQALQSELTFAQLWAKSGLGTEPKLLAVGPLENDALPDLSGDTSKEALRPLSTSQILTLDAKVLPLEFDRLDADSLTLQRSLGDMLEYFHDAALLLSNTPSVKPSGGFLTSSFGKRKHPIFGGWVMHKGLDIGGRIGMEVFAPADGVVIFTGYRGGYGQTVVIDHGYGLQTHYAHLSKYRCRAGDKVRRGDLIAEMGNTGSSTGPHLHYEVRRGGQPLNPLRFVLD